MNTADDIAQFSPDREVDRQEERAADSTSSPEPKRTKADGEISAPAASTTDVAVAASPSFSIKLYEFKFEAVRSEDFDDHTTSGVFQIPFLVNNDTGVLSFPQDEGQRRDVDVKGKIKWHFRLMPRGASTLLEMPLHAKIIPSQNRADSGDENGTGSGHVLRLGIRCEEYGENKNRYRSENKKITTVDWDDIDDPTDWENIPVTEFVSVDTIEALAANVGGEISFETREGYYLKLYTVISQLCPGQSIEKLTLPDVGQKPNWERLENRVKNHPKLNNEFDDIVSAVIEYKRYIALKILKDDHDSKKYAPSPDIDKIWHLHMVFPEEYQQDCMALAQELSTTKLDKNKQKRGITKPFVIQHNPFLLKDTRQRYYNTLFYIKSKEFSTLFGQKVDYRLWPDEDDAYPEGGGAGCC